MKNKKISIVIPSFNEIKNIKRNVLDHVYNYLTKSNIDFELILSDDGSTDGTTEKLVDFAKNKKNVYVLKNKHKGKGPTVIQGFLKAKGDFTLFTDFDQSTPIQELEKLIKFTDKYDFIIGSREGIGALRKNEPVIRHIMGRVFNFLVRLITQLPYKDTQCGFKLFNTKKALTVIDNLQVYRYNSTKEINKAFTGAFDVEILYIAKHMGFKIKEVPIKWNYHETSRVNPLRDSIKMFIDILKIRLFHLLNKYNFNHKDK